MLPNPAEIPVRPPPVAPSPMPPARPRPSRASQMLAGGALLLLIAGALLYAYDYGARETRSSLLVSIGLTPGSPMLIVSEGTATLPDASWIPEGLYLTDAVTLTGDTYVLLFDPATLTANVYEKRGAVVTKLTSSNTMKYSLEGDKTTGNLAYLSVLLESEIGLANIAAAEVVILQDGIETSVSQGLDLVGFAGGELGIKTRDGILVYKDGVTRGPVYDGVLPVAATDGEKFIAYNTQSRAIDTYDVTAGFSALRYISSTPVDYIPTALGFANGEVVAAGLSSETTYFVASPSMRVTMPKASGAVSGIPFSFTNLSL